MVCWAAKAEMEGATPVHQVDEVSGAGTEKGCVCGYGP